MTAKKKKISVRKILQAFTTLVAASACITAIISASKIEGDKMLDHVEVHINSGKKYHFIEEKQILNETINNRNIDILHTAIHKLDIQGMERILKADPWVADASLYVDARRVLHMSVTQRIPAVRIFGQQGNSYYMDNTRSIMPLAPNFIYYTSVVTNMPPLGNDSASDALKKQVLLLVHAIQADTFWNAQVSQIIVDSNSSFELIPVLGQQKIIFGDTSRMKEKFTNLYAFYMNVLNRIGWDKYETLDVRFRGQVIAAPSLPYKGPVDKAMISMNWINSIVQTEARIDSGHAVAAEAKAKEVASANPKKEAKPAEKIKPKVEPAKKEVKPEVKKEVRKEIKAEPKNILKPETKKEIKTVIKTETKKEVKKDAAGETKKDTKSVKTETKKETAKETKKDTREVKKEPTKEVKKEVRKEEVKKETKAEPKKKEEASKDKAKDTKPKAKYELPENK